MELIRGESMHMRNPGSREGSAPDNGADVASSDVSYEGPHGETRLEAVHLPLPSGEIRTLSVYRAINVATHPELREAALDGGLHRFDTGEELAVPFVFHDPAARKLGLVVPETLRHRALLERARVMTEIASDTEHPVPAYVRDVPLLIGLGELRAWVERPLTRGGGAGSGDAKAEAREKDLRAKEDQLAIWERELSQRVEQLTAREQDLERRNRELAVRIEGIAGREKSFMALSEELDATQRDIVLREQELESRMAMLDHRMSSVRRERFTRPIPTIERVDEADVEHIEDDVEELTELDVVGTNPLMQLSPEPAGSLDADPFTLGRESQPELVDDSEVEAIEEVSDLDDVMRVSETELEPSLAEDRSEAPLTEVVADGQELPGALVPPSIFFEETDREMLANLGEEGVRLFVRVGEGHEHAFTPEAAELLPQLSVIQDYPVVLLTLVDSFAGVRPYVRRAALDPRDQRDRAVLEALADRFEVTVALFSSDGRFERTMILGGLRAGNMRRILERCDSDRPSPGVDAVTAADRALSAPPPIRDKDQPFASSLSPAPDLRTARERAERLGRYTTARGRDRAILVLSVPEERLEQSVRRVLEDALRLGVGVPRSLAEQAVSYGVAESDADFLTRQARAFAELVADPGRAGLSKEEIADNWESLLAAGSEMEVDLPDDVHEKALAAVREIRGDAAGIKGVDAKKLDELDLEHLRPLLEHPKLRAEAAIELCRRRDPDTAAGVLKAVRKMTREEVLRVMPRVLQYGESAGDALIDALGARKTFVRQAAALALSRLKLRRAVAPLVHLLQEEPSEVWQEIARALSEFGPTAFRSLSRGFRDPKADPDRFAYALAHLAHAGCGKQIDELARDADAKLRTLGTEALGLREQAGAHRAGVTGDGRLGPEDQVRGFSRRFYEERARVDETTSA